MPPWDGRQWWFEKPGNDAFWYVCFGEQGHLWIYWLHPLDLCKALLVTYFLHVVEIQSIKSHTQWRFYAALWVYDMSSFFKRLTKLSVWGTKAELKARVGRPQTSWSPPVMILLADPRQVYCFGSLVILDVACCYLCLFSLYINIK